MEKIGSLYCCDTANTELGQVDFTHSTVDFVRGAGFDFSAVTPSSGIAVDSGNGCVYVADQANNRVLGWRNEASFVNGATADLIIGQHDQWSDQANTGGVSISTLSNPVGVATDPSGNLYIADTGNNVVREVAASTGIITTVAGNGSYGYTGDGSLATTASFAGPAGIAVDAAGDLYIADFGNNVIREVNALTGIIDTIAGGGSNPGNDGLGDGGPAIGASLDAPAGLALDSAGNLYIADRTGVREVSGGVISTVANTGGFPTGVSWANGFVYFTDSYTQKAYQVAGSITSEIAGNGTAGFGGDGGPALAAELNHPTGIAVDPAGDVFIADSANDRLRVVTGGTITTYAGTGSMQTPDGGQAAGAQITQAQKVTVDGQGGYFFSEEFKHVVRHVDATGRITTVAGNGTQGFGGDGGPATSAELNNPVGLAVDAGGNLYVGDFSARSVHVYAPPLSATSKPTVSLQLDPLGQLNTSLTCPASGTNAFNENLPRRKSPSTCRRPTRRWTTREPITVNVRDD